MREIEGVKIYRCDARSDKLLTELKKDYGEFNGVISDMAPNFSGTLFETHQ